MAAWRRLTLAFCLGCLFLCSLAPHSVSLGTAEDENHGSSGMFSSGGRNLLQITNSCPYQFALILNFTNLEETCPQSTLNNSANYPKKACCAALADLLCPYRSVIDDSNSQCSANFWYTLDIATNHTLQQTLFQVICTDPNQPNGIPCPAGAPAPITIPPNQSSPKSVLHSFGLALLMAVALVEFLCLCF